VVEIFVSTLDHLVAKEKSPVKSLVFNVQNVVLDFAKTFDYLPNKEEHCMHVTKHFLRLFSLSLRYLHESRSANFPKSEATLTCPTEDAPWWRLLDEFRTDQSFERKSTTRDDDDLTGTAEHVDMLKSDTDFVAGISWRCCFLFSHPALEIQRHACDVVKHCFEYLGWVATLKEAKSNELNGPTTSVIRQIHSSWPDVSAKLVNLCAMVNSTTTGFDSFATVSAQQHRSRSVEAIFDQHS